MSTKKIVPQAVIFDFDGTLADTGPIIRAIYTELAQKNNWPEMTDEAYAKLRKGSLHQARQWVGIRWWQFPSLVRSAKQLMKLESEKVKLFPGAVDLIRELQKENINVYILSRNLPDTIQAVLERYGLEQKVEILSYKTLFFGSKRTVIAKLLLRQRYKRKAVWMVGDETRDIRAARSTGVNSIAVGWGLQDISILERNRPTEVAATMKQLKNILL